MAISVFDIYKVGVGPSSSHTFGPMVAAQRFLKELETEKLFDRTAKAQIELYASMALTGKGHFTDLASMLGLEGNEPVGLDSATIPAKQKRIETEKTLNLGGKKMVPFDPAQDIKWYGDKRYPTHPNGIAFLALDSDGNQIKRGLYFSIGGGFVICENESNHPMNVVGDVKKPFPYTTARELAGLFELSDQINAYALAVMEVNATLGRVVTAPTMGSSGIVPAVLQAYKQFGENVTDDKICDFLLASGGCAIPVKVNASFSGAEVGCQGEVGAASLMAATGLCQVLGGTIAQVFNAGAMALEHNLGLTCDPVAGLVQVPC